MFTFGATIVWKWNVSNLCCCVTKLFTILLLVHLFSCNALSRFLFDFFFRLWRTVQMHICAAHAGASRSTDKLKRYQTIFSDNYKNILQNIQKHFVEGKVPFFHINIFILVLLLILFHNSWFFDIDVLSKLLPV